MNLKIHILASIIENLIIIRQYGLRAFCLFHLNIFYWSPITRLGVRVFPAKTFFFPPFNGNVICLEVYLELYSLIHDSGTIRSLVLKILLWYKYKLEVKKKKVFRNKIFIQNEIIQFKYLIFFLKYFVQIAQLKCVRK